MPVPTGSESADFDRRAIEETGVPQAVLMENAGRAAADLAERVAPEGPVLALVGSGNNGGDALVALRTLASRGREVSAVLVGDRAPDGLLHGWSFERVSDESASDADVSVRLASAALVIDGILGTGLSGPPRARQVRVIELLDRAARPTLALDVPSGVDADTGAVPGAAVHADATIAFGFPKLGSLLQPARGHAGRLVAVEIGFPPVPEGVFSAELITPGWSAARRPRRSLDTHKRAVGTLLVVAGRKGMAGAAVLAARAAVRAGAGLVHVASPASNRVVIQKAVPEAVFVDASDQSALGKALAAADAVVVGPGLGTDPEAAAALAAVLDAEARRPLLIDADGLNLLAARDASPAEVVTEPARALVTPHPGEMARLLRSETDEVQSRRVAVARDFAAESGVTVLLKGTPSLVAAPGRRTLVSSTGSSAFATGGMGDVLSGIAGALLAQGLSPRDAAGVALMVSGRAAALAGERAGLMPSDVSDALPAALEEEGPGDSDLGLPGLLFDQDPPT